MSIQHWFKANIQRIINSSAFIIGAIVVLRTFVIDWSVVPSGSMTKTFMTGDIVLNNKMAYGYYGLHSLPIIGTRFAKKKIVDLNIKRGDIIVFCGKKDFITKRVLGIPGDVVEWDNTDLIINGESTVFNKDGTRIYPNIDKFLLTKNHHDLNIDEVMDVVYSRVPVEKNRYLKVTRVLSKSYLAHGRVTYKIAPGYSWIYGDNQYPSYSWDSRNHDLGPICNSKVTGRAFWVLCGSNAKIFNRKRNLISWAIMLPYLVLRYLLCLDFTRFGSVDRDYFELNRIS